MRKILALVLVGLMSACGGGTGPTVLPTPTPVPTVSPTPTMCPIPAALCAAREFKAGLHTCADVAFGDTCLVDSTGFFEGGRCNAESSDGCPPNECGRRRECEPDPFNPAQFPQLHILSGANHIERVVRNCTEGYPNCDAPGDNSYQWRLVHVTGKVRLEVCWPDGARDQHGDPIDMTHATCGVAVINPLVP